MPVVKKAIEALTTAQGIGFMVDKLPICMILLLIVVSPLINPKSNSEIRLAGVLFISQAMLISLSLSSLYPRCTRIHLVPSWFPGAHFKRFVEAMRPHCEQILEGPFKDTKDLWESFFLPLYDILFSHLLCSLLERRLILMSRDYLKNLEGPKFPGIRNRSLKNRLQCCMQVCNTALSLPSGT